MTGFVAGDTQASATTGALEFSSATTPASPVGSYAITGSGLAAVNYTFVEASDNASALTITADTVTIVSGLTADDKVYDGTNTATLSLTNTVVLAGLAGGDAGSVTLSTNGYVATFADSNATTNITVTVAGLTLTGGDYTNYTLTQPVLSAAITPAPVTIASGLTVDGVVYGTLSGLDAASLSSNNVVLTGVVAQDLGSVSLVTNGYTAAFTDTNANPAVPVTVAGLSLGGSEATNYSLTEPSLTGAINPATLTYAATAASQPYGSANTSFAGTVTGFVYSDTQSSATAGALAFTSATTPVSPVGSYAITGSGLTASNYTFVQASANASALTIVLAGGTYSGNIIDNTILNYDGSAPETLLGVVSGPGVLSVSGTGTLTLTAADTYTGRTIISSGTLALGGGGSIADTSGITIGAGATLDVSGLGAGATFNMPGTSFTASGDAPATILGPAHGTVNMGSLPITLDYDGLAPSLVIEQSTLSLHDNVFTVNTFSGSALSAGSYIVIIQYSGDISGTVAPAVTGTAIPATGTTNFMAISGDAVLLNILNLTSTALSGGSSTTYGSPLSITATVSPAPPDGEAVVFYAGAVPISTNTTVGGVASLTISSLPPGLYSITATYVGDDTNAPSTSSALAQTVEVNATPINLSLSVSNNQLTLSWPADHLGWTLETNSIDLSNAGDWFAYPGSTSKTSETITIDRTQTNVYFRLVDQ